MEGDDDKSRKYRKKKVNKLRKAEKRKQSLNYLTNMVGKEEQQSITHIYIINNDRSKSKLCKRNEVEAALINQSLRHFRKAMKTKAYQDKIYTQLKKNQV